MKILHDARYLTQTPSGIRTYSEGLLAGLAEIDPDTQHLVVTQPDYVPEKTFGSNFRFISFAAAPVSLKTIFSLQSIIKRESPDIVHSHYPIIPLRCASKRVVTVHDLQPLQMKEWTGNRPAPIKLLYDAFYRSEYPAAIKQARAVLCDSEFVKQAIAEMNPAWAQKCHVAPLGPPPMCDTSHIPNAMTQLRERYGLPQRYALFVGSTRPNKNIPAMLRAFARMHRRTTRNQDVKFVLVLVKDRFYAEIEREIAANDLQEKVLTLPPCDSLEKSLLYRNAQALFFATQLEGFGFPVLEANQAEIPVLTSDSGSLPEVAGESALVADPLDVEDLAAKMERILSDEKLRSELVEKGRTNLLRFSWKKHAEMVRDVYLNVSRG